jgi:hypothetical protein
MMEALSSPETSAFTRATRCNFLEDGIETSVVEYRFWEPKCLWLLEKYSVTSVRYSPLFLGFQDRISGTYYLKIISCAY